MKLRYPLVKARSRSCNSVRPVSDVGCCIRIATSRMRLAPSVTLELNGVIEISTMEITTQGFVRVTLVPMGHCSFRF